MRKRLGIIIISIVAVICLLGGVAIPALANLKLAGYVPTQQLYEPATVCTVCDADITGEGAQSELAKALALDICMDCWLDILYGSPRSSSMLGIARIGEDGKVLPEQLPAGSGGETVWGDVTGTLSDQTDLQGALDGKETSGAVNTHESAFAHSDLHQHSNISILDATQEAFTTSLKTSYNWLVTNITSAWKSTVDNFISSKGQAGGLAPLDSGSKVPTENLGGSGADSTKYLRGDQTWATPDGGGGGGLTVSGATVFSGSSPTSWTDLNLSGTIGANSALVVLSIEATADMDCTAVRMNGDTTEYWHGSSDANAYGVAMAHHDSTAGLVLICVTDGSGIMEWITESSRSATITLIAYMK